MDKPSFTRQSSGMRNIPSFNDFGSMVADDVDIPAPRMSAPIPTPKAPLSVSVPNPTMLDRRWSVESDASMSPPSRLGSSMSGSFSDTFKRALYEHMRGN